ncbi:hypothetical protein EC973_005724 [Apophysomyces ossiformis]|uniref:Uncharacterized protein n=1 Tax=Apophysomyces ossiformis TaxID=679940 RepID=A0A8H7BU72_9FUNG|nr:hypothetical protein EC973_005724 [Apophysomyces ossiformis]
MDKADTKQSSAYTADMFTLSALAANHLKPITAVLLRTSDDESKIVYIVQQLLEYPFVKEIRIQDNIKLRPLTIEQLKLNPRTHSRVNVEILQAEEDLGSFARYTMCALGSYDHCYFQDDLWINNYLDTMYTSFLRNPDLVHSMTDPAQYSESQRWQFNNQDIKMHAGYSSFQYGAFVPRWKTQNFLTQLGKSGVTKNRQRYSDIYFIMWTNQYPWILSNSLRADQKPLTQGLDPDRFSQILNDAIRRLQGKLESDTSSTPKDYFMREQGQPSLADRDIRLVNERMNISASF